MGVVAGLVALGLGSGCDAEDAEGETPVQGPTGGKADGAEGSESEPGPFHDAPYARLSAADRAETQPVRFAPHPTSSEDMLSIRVLEDGRDVVERREAGQVWTANPFFTVTAATDVRADWLREQVVLSSIERSGSQSCCGTSHGTLSAAVFDSSQDAGSWTQRTRRVFVDDRVMSSGLALDQDGEPHLAYVRNESDSTSTKTLEYADCTGAQECAYESVADFSEGGKAVGLVLGADGEHQALVASSHGLAVYARQLDENWAPGQVIDSDLVISRLIVEQGFDRAVVVAEGVADGTDAQVAIYESIDGAWEEIQRVEYPWVLNSSRSNRSAEARLTTTGVVVGTGACLEYELQRDLLACARSGWRVFREADAFSMEEIFVDGERHPAAPVLGVDGNPYSLGTSSQPIGFYRASGEIRAPEYTYDQVDEDLDDLHGTLITDLRVRFRAPWSSEYHPAEARTRVDCSMWGDNPGFITLSCTVQIEDPHRPPAAFAEAFTIELDSSMSIVHDTDDRHFTAHVERSDEGTDVVIDDFQVFIDSPQPPVGGRARVVDMEPLRIPLQAWDD